MHSPFATRLTAENYFPKMMDRQKQGLEGRTFDVENDLAVT